MDRFPNSLIAFQRMFPDEAACAAWLVSMRWPEGFECPRCSHDHGWALRGKAPVNAEVNFPTLGEVIFPTRRGFGDRPGLDQRVSFRGLPRCRFGG